MQWQVWLKHIQLFQCLILHINDNNFLTTVHELSWRWRMVNLRLYKTARLIYSLQARDLLNLAKEIETPRWYCRQKLRWWGRWNLTKIMWDMYFLKSFTTPSICKYLEGAQLWNPIFSVWQTKRKKVYCANCKTCCKSEQTFVRIHQSQISN